MSQQFCIVIPNYNHAQVIDKTICDLQRFNLPILLVDDGSNDETQHVLQIVGNKYANVTLHRREQNGGKGAAVHSGLKLAHQMGMSHALQVDADGQHNLDDIDKLLETSRLHPDEMISGQPIYDGSISKGRYYGRFITHFWVYVETLSFTIKDSMCGFRVYPLDKYVRLTEKTTLGKRMDYDIEVMVRLFWLGVPIRFIPTKVLYPVGGVSHFNLWQDNWLISKMHTRLVFGMILRLPVLLWRKFKRSA